jgi:capsular polysaccharide biosynthesis protein
MRWRRVTNDSEIARFLTAWGFNAIDIESYAFAEQVRIFREAECIVAPEGSALLNVIFCDPAVKLMVLAQRDFWHGYYGPLRALGYEQLWVVGDAAIAFKQADYAVPVKRIEKALKMLLGDVRS